MTQARVADLFAGIGGMRIAFKNAGASCVFSSEIDKFARETYQANFNVEPAGDITKIPLSSIPDHDILTAGFPCQPFSMAGKRQGLLDKTRGTLFFNIAEILGYKRPKCFLLENVRGLLSSNNGKTFQTIISTLETLGYHVYPKLINSKHWVPQNRNRVFIVGFDASLFDFNPGLEFPHLNNFEFPTCPPATHKLKSILEPYVQKKYILTNKAFQCLKDRKEGSGFGVGVVGPENQARTLTSRYGKDGSEILIKLGIVGKGAQGEQVYSPEGLALALTAGAGGGRANTGLYQLGVIGKGGQAERIYSPEGLSSTLSAEGGGGGAKTGLYQTDHETVRRLTPRECARLQGFPESFKIVCSDSQAYRQFGNSVTVPVVEAIARQMIKKL